MLAPSQSILETAAPSVDIAAHAKNAWKNHKSQLHSPIPDKPTICSLLTLFGETDFTKP